MNKPIILLSLFLLLSSTGLAKANIDYTPAWGLESCYQPGIMPAGWYEYVDGLNNSFDFNSGTYNVTDVKLNSTIEQRLGVDGLTKIVGIHWHDFTTKERGLAYLYYNNVTSVYRAVFQYQQRVWTIPGLVNFRDSNGEWYSNGLEVVLFENSAGAPGQQQNWSVGKLSVTFLDGDNGTCGTYGTLQCTEGVFFGYKYGNASGFNIATRGVDPIGNNCWKNGGIGAAVEGFFDDEYTPRHDCFGAVAKWYASNMTFGNVSNQSRQGDTGRHPLSDGGTVGDGWHWWTLGTGATYEDSMKVHDINYWGCAIKTGKVVFSGYVGASSCAIYEDFNDFPCYIAGDVYSVPEANSTTTTENTSDPDFSDILAVTENKWIIEPHENEIAGVDSETELGFYKAREHESQLSINLRSDISFDWWEPEFYYGTGTITDAKYFFRIGYNPPTGNINNIDLNGLTVNTTLDSDSAVCYCDYLFGIPIACHNYTLNFVVGYNSTHFKQSNVSCFNGNKSEAWAFLDASSMEDNFTQQQLDTINKVLPSNEDALDPLAIDSTNEVITRFFLLWFDVQPGTKAMNDGDVVFGDNEQFLMHFNWTNYQISSVATDEYVYGNYSYICVLPAGLADPTNSSFGFVVIDEPVEFVKIIMEKPKDLSLDLYLRKQGVSAPGAICTSSTGEVKTSNLNGVCEFEYVAPNSQITITATYYDLFRNATMDIGDYYNSQGYGVGETCGQFDGTYVYVWDLEYDSLLINLHVSKLSTGTPVDRASVLWNTVSVGSTNKQGNLEFTAPTAFGIANLTVQHECFITFSQDVTVAGSRMIYRVELTENADCNYEEDYAPLVITDQSGIINTIGNKQFLGAFLVILSGAAGLVRAGLPGGSLGFGGSAFLLSLVGFFPWVWTIPLLLLATIVGTRGVRDQFFGGGND